MEKRLIRVSAVVLMILMAAGPANAGLSINPTGDGSIEIVADDDSPIVGGSNIFLGLNRAWGRLGRGLWLVRRHLMHAVILELRR